ncbi:MAG: hypothetical protein AAFQ67_01995 [Pseudomonadota bacterium]
MRLVTAGLAFASCAACATPGIDYVADIAPGNPAAASYTNVAVDQFQGPYAGWYGDRFRAMLVNAEFDGAPWFQVGLFGGQSNVNGVFGGYLELSPVEAYETYSYHTRCVLRDDDKTCVTRERIEEVCVRFSASVAASPQLVDKDNLRVVHDATYTASRSRSVCGQTGYVEVFSVVDGEAIPHKKKGRRGRTRRHRAGSGYPFHYGLYRHPAYLPDPDDVVDGLYRDALEDTVWQARRDLAPYNQVRRANFVSKAVDPALAADPRFGLALDAAKQGDAQTSCAYWRDLSLQYADAPAATHNSGACSEALGDYEGAQALYAKAAELSRDDGVQPLDRTLQALSRISQRRVDNRVIDSLVEDPSS